MGLQLPQGLAYDSYRYLYPPRPGSSRVIAPERLPELERDGYAAQFKFNGTSNCIAVSPRGEIICMNRHAEAHKAWKPNPAFMKAFLSFPRKGWWYFCAELLHSKVANLRDINYVHDVLVADSTYLVGSSQEQRQTILHEVFRFQDTTKTHFIVDDHTWVTHEYTSGFTNMFQEILDANKVIENVPNERLTSEQSLIRAQEGLVFKKMSAPLALCGREGLNDHWQYKIRRPHKNYSR